MKINLAIDPVVESLSSVQKELLFLVLFYTQKHREITMIIHKQLVAKTLNMNVLTLTCALRRLYKKSLLELVDFKSGRDGWAEVIIPNVLRAEIKFNISHYIHDLDVKKILDFVNADYNYKNQIAELMGD